MLSAADIAYMQDTQETAMPGTVVIERRAYVDDGMGGSSETWAGAGTVIGRVYPQTSRTAGEAIGGAQIHSHTTWWATLPVGTDVQAHDRVVYQDRSWEV